MNKVWVLIKRVIKDQRKTLLAYTMIAVALVWMFVVFFPTIARQSESFSQLLANYPESFLKAFGIEKGMTIFSNLESFLAMEHYSLMWPLLLLSLLISFGSSALAGEIEKGTVEILLSLPLSRSKIFLAKYLAGIFLLSVFVLFSILSIAPLAKVYNLESCLTKNLSLVIVGGLFGLSVLGLTLMFSSFLSERGLVASLTGGTLLLMYALDLLAKLREDFGNLKYLSLFHYYDYNAALVEGKIDSVAVGVFLGVSLSCTLIGLLSFQKRDIAT